MIKLASYLARIFCTYAVHYIGFLEHHPDENVGTTDVSVRKMPGKRPSPSGSGKAAKNNKTKSMTLAYLNQVLSLRIQVCPISKGFMYQTHIDMDHWYLSNLI